MANKDETQVDEIQTGSDEVVETAVEDTPEAGPSAEEIAAAQEQVVSEFEQAVADSDAIDDEEDEATGALAANAASAETVLSSAGSVTVTADADLRVVVPTTMAVFCLQKKVPRVLPRKLAMAALTVGGQQNVIVRITE